MVLLSDREPLCYGFYIKPLRTPPKEKALGLKIINKRRILKGSKLTIFSLVQQWFFGQVLGHLNGFYLYLSDTIFFIWFYIKDQRVP